MCLETIWGSLVPKILTKLKCLVALVGYSLNDLHGELSSKRPQTTGTKKRAYVSFGTDAAMRLEIRS